MPIVVNGSTTITDVNVNGSPMSSVNVNGTNVFSGEVIYYGLQIHLDSTSTLNPDVVRQSSGFIYNDPGNYYGIAFEVWRGTSVNYTGIIFKDFDYIKLLVNQNDHPDAHRIMYGTCTKSATLPNVIRNGTGRLTYTNYVVPGNGTHVVEVYGGSDRDIFLGLNCDSGETFYVGGAMHINTDQYNCVARRSY